ncbi:MAG: hypothetical protein LBQ44_06215 [Treponema sp.]|nr:hypothetical protein [Treponema sp.]
MKVSRKALLIVTAALGGLLILYSVLRHFNIVALPEKWEKYLMDGVIFAALAVFMYNRKLARDERKAREAAERAAEEERNPPPEEEDPVSKPHWERSGSEDGGD